MARFAPAPSRRLAAAVVVAVALATGATTTAQGPSAYPGIEWQHIADPSTVGFCTAGLEQATEQAGRMATTGAMAVVDGRVLWSYGDLAHVSYVASVRKSILAMLYGNDVASGRIDLEATLADLNIDDVEGLLAAEKEATVADLLGARSGVYHEATNAACAGCGSTAGDPPGPRGSVPHGTYFLYNNWDFNALGTIFEQQTRQSIYDAFENDLAKPLGLQDFDRASHRRGRANQRSMHGAYHFNLSARDLARIGYLMLREGEWAGRQLVPRDWVRRITTVVTPVSEMNPDNYRQGPFGYGYLWWIWDGPYAEGAYRGAYTGIGAVGQFLTVLPELGMVIAHKTNTGGESVGRPEYLQLVDRLVSARCQGVVPPTVEDSGTVPSNEIPEFSTVGGTTP